jgi:hypothetical protein
MALKKGKSRRKRYATEFLIRSDDPNLISDLTEIAGKKQWSVNVLVNNELKKLVEKHKKVLVISK